MQLNQLLIYATDVKKSAAFYVKLGCEIVVFGDEYIRLLDPAGQTTFSLAKTDKPPSPDNVHLYFECASKAELAKKVKSLKAQKIDISEPTDQRWLWREAETYGPDGYKIKLYYAGENRIFPPWGVKQR